MDYGKDSGYLDRLAVEKDAPVADLYLSKASGLLESAANSGLFGPIPKELADRVPTRFQGANNQWVGLSARARVLVRRKGLDTPPNTLEDLIQPARAGTVARTVATNSSFRRCDCIYCADHGEEKARVWLGGLQTNSKGNVHPKHTPAVAAVAEGQADVALVNHYYFYRNILGKTVDPDMTAEDIQGKLDAAPIEIVYPDTDNKGVAWNVSGAGLVKGGPNPKAAAAVLDVLLSDEGQKSLCVHKPGVSCRRWPPLPRWCRTRVQFYVVCNVHGGLGHAPSQGCRADSGVRSGVDTVFVSYATLYP